ncbi:hypothetical protein [Phenylobacterium zucineum]|nr:hypothetical protein [Phenylobacterium zucineum]
MVLWPSEAGRSALRRRRRRLGALLSLLSVVLLSAALWILIVRGLMRLLG